MHSSARSYRPLPSMVAEIPAKSSSFELVAKFGPYTRGRYCVRWRIKALGNFSIPNGLHFKVNVTYEAEAESDVTGSLDMIMPQQQLERLQKDQWYNIELEEKLIIQPHQGSARVQLILCNINKETPERYNRYSGLAIEHVEIRPAELQANPQVDIAELLVRRACSPSFVIRSTDAYPSSPDSRNSSNDPATAVITRLAYSKNSRFLATLALTSNVAYITVWDVTVAKLQSRQCADQPLTNKGFATTEIGHIGVADLEIGISISASGDQIAIYQEPKIGQWADDSPVEKASFPFRVFNNPLVPQAATVLDIGEDENIGGNKTGLPEQDEALISQPLSIVSASIISADVPKSTPVSPSLQEVTLKYGMLGGFIGYGAFLPETKKDDWEKNDLNGTLFSNPDDDNHSLEDNDDGGEKLAPSSMFVACNGLNMEVFEISSEKKWSHMHTITVRDLIPTLSRRITCKMMMESITSNTFMWLEDGGLCCSIWNLLTGSNISHISKENARFKGPTFRGHSKMAMSPHESIVALASVDGSLTTYFAKTGLEISVGKFPGYKIEYVGFYTQDNQVIVVLRDNITFELSSRILDALQLKNEIAANVIPVPTIGSAVLATFNVKGLRHRGIVCEAEGNNVNCYIAHQPASSRVNIENPKVVKAEPDTISTSWKHRDAVKYELKILPHKETLPEGDGAQYSVLHVELIQTDDILKAPKTVFSFVPEPWVRVTVGQVPDSSSFITAYFIPGGTRFAIVGKQTLQIWNLPTPDNVKCTLQFIWSQPKGEGSTYVEDYYSDIASVSIYVDIDNGNTVADIKSVSAKKKRITLPGEGSGGARHAILYCFRSIHLLAAAYAYCHAEINKVNRDVPQVNLMFEDHEEALARFTREHINRMMSIKLYSPRTSQSKVSTQDKQESVSSTGAKNSVSNSNAEVVTILTLLMDTPHLKKANHVFVQGLLSSGNGDWIPRDNTSLNPIKRAIRSKNVELVEVFIEYCIKNTKGKHPAYMLPAIQCLKELSESYPNILAEMFKKASYVPAHNYAYVTSHAIVSNMRYSDWINFFMNYYSFKLVHRVWVQKSHNINDYHKPIFSVRSQLPFRAVNSNAFLSIETSVLKSQDLRFPAKREEIDEQYNHKVFVCPFPRLSKFRMFRGWVDEKIDYSKSAFTNIAGQEFFDSPAMVATLGFKWEEVNVRYLKGWYPFIKVTIFIGFLLIIYDLQRFNISRTKYLSSPFNYLHLVSHLLAITGLFLFLNAKEDSNPNEQGPSQIWVMSFAILALYMNLLFELRVVKQLGIVANIILNITRRITWLFVIFGLFLVSFTHAMLHLLHTRSYRPNCIAGTCDDIKDYPDGYPQDFFPALSATYFYLAGRYDPVSTSLQQGSVSFNIMMVIFFFFTTVLMLNILIALMNDAYNESKDEGQSAWLKQWSDVIADAEMNYLSDGSRQNRNYFPDYIYYGASEKEADLYESKYHIANKSNLSIENRFMVETVSKEQNDTQKAQRAIMRDINKVEQSQDTVSQELLEIKKTVQQELADMRKMMELILAQAGGVGGQSGISVSTPTPFSVPSTGQDRQSPIMPPLSPPAPRVPYGEPETTGEYLSSSPFFGQRTPEQADTSPSIPVSPAPRDDTPAESSHGGPSGKQHSLHTKASQSLLRERIQAVVHTMDEAPKSQHQRVEGQNATHPLYIKPLQREDDDDIDDDDDAYAVDNDGYRIIRADPPEFPDRTQSEMVVPTSTHEVLPLHVHPPRGGRPPSGDLQARPS
ncbi:hypothetical protein EDD11_001931 [Mortierella claussenii]|nr:hypothetical protein EDD11_001931 [Mortierella claussenii]